MFVLTMVALGVTLALTGAVTGVYFAFSVSVLPGLNALSPGQAFASMRSINEKILNPAFLTTFVGTPVAAAATGVLLLIDGEPATAWALFAAAGVYVAGAFVPTAAINVPLNNTLTEAPLPVSDAEADRLWTGFSARWTRWNTIRFVASTLSLLLTALAAYIWGTHQ